MLFVLLLLCLTTVTPLTSRPVAIVTGGTRGIGAGISEALLASSSEPFDLILNYGSNKEAAEKTAKALKENWPESQIELVGGDLTKPSVREEIFKCYDKKLVKESQ